MGRLLSRSRTVSHSPPISGPHIGRPRPLAAGPYSRVCSQSHRPVSGRSPPEHLRSRNSRSPHGTRKCSSAPGAVSALSAAQPSGRTNPHPRTHSALSVPARPHGTLREEKLLIPPTMAIRGIQSVLRGMSAHSGSFPVCMQHSIPFALPLGSRTLRCASDAADFGLSPLARCHQLRGSSSPCVPNLLVPTPECPHSERRIPTLRESPLHHWFHDTSYTAPHRFTGSLIIYHILRMM